MKTKNIHAPSEGEIAQQADVQPQSDFHPRYDLRILQALRRVMRAVSLHSKKLNAEYQLTSPQLITLLNLNNYGPLTISSIAQQIHLSSSTVVGIVDRLENRKFVARRRDTKDRRLVYINITEEGKAIVAKTPSPLQEKLSEALLKLEEMDQLTIALSLERIVDMMEARHVDASPFLEADSITGSAQEITILKTKGAKVSQGGKSS